MLIDAWSFGSMSNAALTIFSEGSNGGLLQTHSCNKSSSRGLSVHLWQLEMSLRETDAVSQNCLPLALVSDDALQIPVLLSKSFSTRIVVSSFVMPWCMQGFNMASSEPSLQLSPAGKVDALLSERISSGLKVGS